MFLKIFNIAKAVIKVIVAAARVITAIADSFVPQPEFA